jgi:hypothetical protein
MKIAYYGHSSFARSSKLTMPLPKKNSGRRDDLAPASHWRHARFLSARLPAFSGLCNLQIFILQR